MLYLLSYFAAVNFGNLEKLETGVCEYCSLQWPRYILSLKQPKYTKSLKQFKYAESLKQLKCAESLKQPKYTERLKQPKYAESLKQPKKQLKFNETAEILNALLLNDSDVEGDFRISGMHNYIKFKLEKSLHYSLSTVLFLHTR